MTKSDFWSELPSLEKVEERLAANKRERQSLHRLKSLLAHKDGTTDAEAESDAE